MFFISIATVIGPTPPGTGVIHPAIYTRGRERGGGEGEKERERERKREREKEREREREREREGPVLLVLYI